LRIPVPRFREATKKTGTPRGTLFRRKTKGYEWKRECELRMYHQKRARRVMGAVKNSIINETADYRLSREHFQSEEGSKEEKRWWGKNRGRQLPKKGRRGGGEDLGMKPKSLRRLKRKNSQNKSAGHGPEKTIHAKNFPFT